MTFSGIAAACITGITLGFMLACLKVFMKHRYSRIEQKIIGKLVEASKQVQINSILESLSIELPEATRDKVILAMGMYADQRLAGMRLTVMKEIFNEEDKNAAGDSPCKKG